MARDTIGAQAGEPACRCAFVTRVAIHRGMRPKKGEPVHVLLYGLQGNTPAAHRVALFALAAKLPSVEIRMTIGAVHAHIAENQFCVALSAIHRNVHPPKGKACLVVGEIGGGANGLPAGGGVAVFARNAQRAVRTLHPAFHNLSLHGLKVCRNADQHE